MQLTGTELLSTIETMRLSCASNTEIALACGYKREDGKPAFVEFYTAMIEAKGPDFLATEDEEVSEVREKLLENYDEEAIDAFAEYWSEDDLEYFEEAYQGCYRDGAEFARELVEDCYGMSNDLPYWVEIDWEATWRNLSHDYIDLDGYIFSLNW